MDSLLRALKADYSRLKFAKGESFSWSPTTKTVTYKLSEDDRLNTWSLLHELAHALLNHKTYHTDFELLLLEVAAWEKAKELAAEHDADIDEGHIQDCIDTYRDWLHQRSNCPTCGSTSLQQNSTTYKCFNCNGCWTVTASRFCRPYRLSSKQQKTPPEVLKEPQTTFL